MFDVFKRDYLLDKILNKHEKLQGMVLDFGENKDTFSHSVFEASDDGYELYVNSEKIWLVRKIILAIVLSIFTSAMAIPVFDSLVLNISIGIFVFLTTWLILYCIIKTFSYFSLTNKYKKQRKRALREVLSNMNTNRHKQRQREVKFYEKFENRTIYNVEEYQKKFIDTKSKLATKSHFIYHTNLVNEYEKINSLVFSIYVDGIVPIDKTEIRFHMDWLKRYMMEFKDVTVNDLVELQNFFTQLEVKTEIVENIVNTLDTVTDVKTKKEIKDVLTDYIENLDSDIENKFKKKRKASIKENNKIKDNVMSELTAIYKKL